MAFAAIHSPTHPSYMDGASVFQVLEVTVPFANLREVRRVLLDVTGVTIICCKPLRHPRAVYGSAAPRIRLVVKLPLSCYANVLHNIMESVPDGEIGHLASWRSFLGKNSNSPVCASN